MKNIELINQRTRNLKLLAVAKSFRFLVLAGFFLAFVSGCGFKMISNTNRPDYTFSNRLADNSSKSEDKIPVRILFVGDMMFDRYIRQAAEKHGGDYGYIFSDIKNDLEKYDLVVANLEGPITDKKSVSVGTAMDERGNLVFSFDPAVAKTLAENNIKLVNLGNNHILNQGEEGLAETENYLNEAKVEYFGDAGDGGNNFAIRKIGTMRVGIINYNYSLAKSFERAIESIRNIRSESDILVVYPHWGTEYKTGDPGQNTKNLAHEIIDAGADLVVGTHPHVVQVSETYQGKKIYYSLGNFVFDQYFSQGTMQGLAVKVEINPADLGIKFQEIPIRIGKNGRTVFE